MVSLPYFHEDQVLYGMPYFQLGSSDDVQPPPVCGRVLCKKFSGNGSRGVPSLGILYHGIPRTVLGGFQ